MPTAASKTPGAGSSRWRANTDSAGKAAVEEHIAFVGDSRYVIDIAPWGEGRLMVDGKEIARLDGAKDRKQAFSDLSIVAERYVNGERTTLQMPTRSPLILPLRRSFLKASAG
jgi:enoyl-[acyl-carrier protein] reductase I